MVAVLILGGALITLGVYLILANSLNGAGSVQIPGFSLNVPSSLLVLFLGVVLFAWPFTNWWPDEVVDPSATVASAAEPSTTVLGATEPTASTANTAVTVATAEPTTPPTTAQPTTTVGDTTTTTARPTTKTEWVGEPYDLWVPMPDEGPIVGVVGVRHNDTLNVRTGPGSSFDVITKLDPTQTGITGTGEGQQLPSGAVWWRIEANGVVGWANQQYLSRLNGVDDATSFVVGRLGETPVAGTMLDLGLIVANAFTDTNVGSNVVVSIAPTEGDLGEVTYDVVGLGDDSLEGFRLHIFGQPSSSGEGFSLMAVEAATLCRRGVSQGLCV